VDESVRTKGEEPPRKGRRRRRGSCARTHTSSIREDEEDAGCLRLEETGLDVFDGELRDIGGLDLSADTDEGAAEALLGGRIEHPDLDLGRVGSPEDEDELVALTVRLCGILEVKDRIAAVVSGKILHEVVPGGRSGLLLLDRDLLVVRGDAVDDVLKALAELELVEGGSNLVLKSDAGDRHVSL